MLPIESDCFCHMGVGWTGLHPRHVNPCADLIQKVPQETGIKGIYRGSSNFPH